MSVNSLVVDWFVGMGINDLLTTDSILSGYTLHIILKRTADNYKNEFSAPASAINKVTNWNNLIKYLEKINIKVSSQDKSQIMHGNDKIVYNILSLIKRYLDQNNKQTQVDINKIDHRSDPKQSKSLLELFILVIIKNLGLNAKQSVALLSNDSKYLAHILAKGFKEQPNPVLNLLRDFRSLLPKIRQFCVNKQNEVFFLKSIKPGLISKFKQISQLSLQILVQFSLNSPNAYEVLSIHLIPTLVLQYRRHPVFLNEISQAIIKLSKYTKPLLSILTNNMNQKQLLTFCYQILSISQQNSQIKQFNSLAKIQQIAQLAIDSLSDVNSFSIALLLLVKMIKTNFETVTGQQKNLLPIINNLQHLAINKTQHFAAYINGIFTLLEIFGKKKHPIAPAFFKLCVQKYKLTLNLDESSMYAYNLMYTMEQFPSIRNVIIVDAIIQRYENYKEVVTELDIQLLGRIACGGRRLFSEQGDQEEIVQSQSKLPDQRTALKIYNTLSKVFFQDIGNAINIADTIIFIIRSNPNSLAMNQLNSKMVKVCLAVHHANIRKLNISKSIVQGIVKLDQSNAFLKRKNLDVQYFLTQLISLNIQELNESVEPLICYSYIQSQSKNRRQTEGLGKVLSILGNLDGIVRKYQEEVRILHNEKRNKNKTNTTAQIQQRNQLSIVASTDFINKKKLIPGQNYSLYLSKISKISYDAQKGLQKYQKVFDDKKRKVQVQQIKKMYQEQKMQQIQRKHTMKVLEKGVKINPRMDYLHTYLYEFNFKENQLKKQTVFGLSQLHIFNPNQQQSNDLQALKYLMKKYNKILKLFYSTYGGKLRPNSISLFDQLAQKNNLMQVANAWKLFKDYRLDEFITIREAQYLVQKINAQKKKPYGDTNLLDFEAFQDFIIQASLSMFSRPPKDLSSRSISQMVEQAFYQFKMLAGENKIDARLFDEQNSHLQQDQSVAQLKLALKSNPDYILPEGYKKIIQKKVQYFHSVSLGAFNTSYTDVLDILDQVLFQKLGFHLLEPFSQVTTNVYAKSLLSKRKQQNVDDFKEKYFSLNVKKQLLKCSGEDRLISRQVAFCLSQIVDAVQNGKKIVSKNKVIQKQIQMQKRKAQQQSRKKRQRRDQELKKILQTHKQEKSIKKQEEVQTKQSQQQKTEQERKKKQKYEQQLKKKVQQYQQKRHGDKKKEEQQKIKQKMKQQQMFQKKRNQLTRVAKQIQQKKEQEKIKQEMERKQQQIEKQKSKRNLNIRSSPKPLKKLQSDTKGPIGQKIKQEQDVNTQTPKLQQKL